MTYFRWALAPLLVLLLGVSVACGDDSDDDSGDSTATAESTQTTGEEATGATGSLSVAGLAENLANVQSFRFDVSTEMDFDVPSGATSAEGDVFGLLMGLLGNLQAQGSFVAPDRFQIQTNIFGMNVEAIQIGEEAWIDDGSGWKADDGASLPFDANSPAELPFELIPEEELQGAETSQEEVNGQETTRYHFDKDAFMALAEGSSGANITGDLDDVDTLNLDVWVTEERIPVKMVMDLQGESEGSDISINLEFNITDLNDPGITIDRPI